MLEDEEYYAYRFAADSQSDSMANEETVMPSPPSSPLPPPQEPKKSILSTLAEKREEKEQEKIDTKLKPVK